MNIDPYPVPEPFPDLRSLRPPDLQHAVKSITTLPTGLSPGMHTTLAAVDIAGFGHHDRDDEAQMYVRNAMYRYLTEVFATLQLPWSDCYREDRGDGVLIITPPAVSGECLMDPFLHHLHVALRRHNRLASQAARLRLRLAVHTGQIHRDHNGTGGHDLVHLFRLLDAPKFKKTLNASGADLALIVSDQLYQAAIQRGSGLINPHAYRRRRISHKETRARGWIWTPPTSR
jgi:hypothetical protein